MGPPKELPFVTLEQDAVVITRPDQELVRVHNIQEFCAAFPGGLGERCLFSSSVDFPEDFTDDHDLIALCHWLRPGGFAGALKRFFGGYE